MAREPVLASSFYEALSRIGKLRGGGSLSEQEQRLSAAAWVARCVGRKETLPLGDSDVAELARYLEPRNLARGELLFREGVSATGVWMVVSGRLALISGAAMSGHVVEVLTEGDVDGDIGLLLSMNFPYSAWALEDSKLYFVAPEAFEELLRRPQVARRWLTSVALRLSHAQSRIVGLLGATVDVQVCRLLCEEVEGGVVGLSQAVIAAMVGAQRSSVNRVLKELERKGILSLGYREILVVDMERLSRLAR